MANDVLYLYNNGLKKQECSNSKGGGKDINLVIAYI